MATQNLGSLVTYLRGDNTSLVKAVAGSKMQLAGFQKYASGVGIAIAGVLAYKTINAFKEFEEQMRNVNTIARQSTEDFWATGDSVLSMASQFGKATGELTKALYDINSAGFKGAEGIAVLDESTKSAIAGLSTVEMSARAITGVLNAYDMSITKASDVSDMLFRTVEKGVLTFPELTTHMGTALAVAAAAKVPFEQVAAAVATMTKKGMVASRAFISLNMMLMQLVKPTAKITELFDRLGFSSASAALEQVGLAGVMKLIQKETNGSAEAIGKLGFNVRAIRTAFALTSDGGKMFEENLNDIAIKTNRLGARDRALAEQQKTLAYQTKRVGTNFGVLAINMGKVLTEGMGLRGILKGVADTLGALGNLFKGTTGTIIKYTITLASLVLGFKLLKLSLIGVKKAAVWAFGHLITGIANLWAYSEFFFVQLKGYLVAAAYQIKAIAIETAAWTTNIGLLKAAALSVGTALAGWYIGKGVTYFFDHLFDYSKNLQKFYEDWFFGVERMYAEGNKIEAQTAKAYSDLKKLTKVANEFRNVFKVEGKYLFLNKNEATLLSKLGEAQNKYLDDRIQREFDELSATKKIEEVKRRISLLDARAADAFKRRNIVEWTKALEEKIPYPDMLKDLQAKESEKKAKKLLDLRSSLSDITQSMYLKSLTNEEKINFWMKKRIDLIKEMRKETDDVAKIAKNIEIKNTENKINDLKSSLIKKENKNGTAFSDVAIKGSMEDYKASLGVRSTTEDKIEKNTRNSQRYAEKSLRVLESVDRKISKSGTMLLQGAIN